MFRFLVIATLVPVMVFGLSNPQVCNSGAPLPTAVRISGCSAAPCDLVIGTSKTMELSFVAPAGLENPRARVFAESIGMTGEYVLPEEQANVCGRLSYGYCPLDEGEDATYALEMPIDPIYPVTTMVLEISIFNDADVPISCFRFQAETIN